MRKVIYEKYGGPEVLQVIENAPIPEVTAKRPILVRVKFTSVNPMDWKFRNGEIAMMTGTKMPQPMGNDFSGVVVKVRQGVTDYKVGDEVFGIKDGFLLEGTLADYIAVDPHRICKKPASVSFEEAAALGIAGVTGLEMVDRVGRVSRGHDVLVLGATGGVGLFAAQIAKARGANVTGVCSTHGVETAKAFGCDDVIDYSKTDLKSVKRQFDRALFLSGVGGYSTYSHLMKPSSIFSNAVFTPFELFTDFWRNLFARKQNRIVFADVNTNTLRQVGELVERKQVKVNIAKSFSMNQVKEAYQFAENEKFVGKVIIAVE